MAEAAKIPQSRLTPSPRALDKALAVSALRAHRLAEAFGQKVPGITSTVKVSKRKS